MTAIEPLALFGHAWQVIKSNRLIWLLACVAALSGDLLSGIRIGPELNLAGPGNLLQANILDVDSWLRAVRLLGASLVIATALTAVAAALMLAAVLAAKAGLVAATLAGAPGAPDVLGTALRGGAYRLGSLIRVTAMLFAPYLLAAELAGEVLRLVPGIAKLPFYLVLVALLIAGALLPFIQALGVCAIVVHGVPAKPAMERGWRLLRDQPAPMLSIIAALLLAALICRGLAELVLQPVAGVSLLSLLLTALRGNFPNLGQVFGLLVLGSLATLIQAPAYAFTGVVMTLVYQSVEGGSTSS